MSLSDANVEILTPNLSVTDVARVASWHKKVGDQVQRDELLVELEMDKAVLEVTAPVDGVLTEINQDEGSTVFSKQLLGILSTASVELDRVKVKKGYGSDQNLLSIGIGLDLSGSKVKETCNKDLIDSLTSITNKTDSKEDRAYKVRQDAIIESSKRLGELKLKIAENLEMLRDIIFSEEVNIKKNKDDVLIQFVNKINNFIDKVNLFNSAEILDVDIIGILDYSIKGHTSHISGLIGLLGASQIVAPSVFSVFREEKEIIKRTNSFSYEEAFIELEDIEEYIIKVHDNLNRINNIFEEKYLIGLRSYMVINKLGEPICEESLNKFIEKTVKLAIIICDVLNIPLLVLRTKETINGKVLASKGKGILKLNKKEIENILLYANNSFFQLDSI